MDKACCLHVTQHKEDQNIHWGQYTTYHAALNGHLKCLRYAHENGAPWHPKTTYYAAVYGRLECLRYAYQKGKIEDKALFTNGKYREEQLQRLCSQVPLIPDLQRIIADYISWYLFTL